jgi:hypothetical protein
VAAPANSLAHAIYARFSDWLKRFQTAERLPDEAPLIVGDATIGVIGMGRIGTAAYDEMRRRYSRCQWIMPHFLGRHLDASDRKPNL